MSRFSPLARRGTIAPYLWKLPTGKMHGGAMRWYRVATFDETWKPGATGYNCVALQKIDKCELGPWHDAPISRCVIEIGQLGIGSPLRRGLVNYCVPAGEAHLKALELARDINQKLRGNRSLMKLKCVVNDGQNHDKFGAARVELEETKESLQKAKEGGDFMAYCLQSLREELEQTRREIQQLKSTRDVVPKQKVPFADIWAPHDPNPSSFPYHLICTPVLVVGHFLHSFACALMLNFIL
ncbi:hypothetical protein T459_14038 [Capsicum annuum]|uniref:Uncharacterized protein n=1 Tax=Capsicum annuum TaxID=4072 RepID=A0A2G2ZG95_CAPAN|nr:putative pectinesterase/pectinesterase inhibitor 22-like [Capsicum annuum]PHT81023.1 hypothetical protein T459_14038 [Capsicum annuum]